MTCHLLLLPALVRLLGLALPIPLAFNSNDLGVVRQSVNERDRAGRVRKDRVPLLEGEV
jgi:hypothetical protein